MPTLTKEIISAAIVGFEEQRRKLDVQITELRSMLSHSPDGSTSTPKSTGRKKRKMSAAGRKAIAEAQRKRWAASKATAAPAPKAAKKPKRKLSAAGRAAIVAALKKRWAA